MLTARAFDIHLEQLLDSVRRFHSLMQSAAAPYCLVGGMAVYLHVRQQDPTRARLTPDIDAAVRREHLPAVIGAAERAGFAHLHVAGVDTLVDVERPKARSAVHLVRLDDTVSWLPNTTEEGFLIAPVKDLVRMKLTSFRLKDKVHIQDLDCVALITAEIEAELPDLLKQRLAEVRATE